MCVQNTLGMRRTNASNTGAGIHDYFSSCQLRLEEISGMLAHTPLLFPCCFNKINLTLKAEVVFQGTQWLLFAGCCLSLNLGWSCINYSGSSILTVREI